MLFQSAMLHGHDFTIAQTNQAPGRAFCRFFLHATAVGSPTLKADRRGVQLVAAPALYTARSYTLDLYFQIGLPLSEE